MRFLFRPTRKKYSVARNYFKIFPAVMAAVFCLMLSGQATFAAAETPEYLTTRGELTRALGNKQGVIYVGDIDFGADGERIAIGNDVRIIGKPDSSVLLGAYFDITGGGPEGEQVTVCFENVVFDGGFDTASFALPPEGVKFKELFGGTRDDWHGIVPTGYLDLSFSNCGFTNYVSYAGAVIHMIKTDSESDFPNRLTFSMDGCRVYGNITESGTIRLVGENANVRITNSQIYGNTARGNPGILLGWLDAEITDCEIERNHYYTFAPNADDNYLKSYVGGGIHAQSCNLRLIGTAIKHNTTDSGGGLFLNSTNAWIEDCFIAGNRATADGGGLAIFSREGCKTYITNTLIAANKAQRGGALFFSLYDARERAIPADTVEFSFSTIGCNEAEDGTHFIFDDTLTANGVRGKVDLFGCFVLDNSLSERQAGAPDYTYAVSVANALSRNAAPREQLDFPQYAGIRPTPGSEADVTVPAEAMKLWAQGAYADIEIGRKIGWKGLAANADSGSANANPLVFILPVAALLCVAGIMAYIIGKKRKRKSTKTVLTDTPKNEQQNTQQPGIPNDIAERLGAFIQGVETLSAAERRVFDCYGQGCTPREAEDRLNLSKSTIKTHNRNIYAKLTIGSYDELMLFIKWMRGCASDER